MGNLGKYRGVIISIVLFLVLDASVLTLNFYISYEIADDALQVNLAGRQRMLTQRTMKSLLDVESVSGDTEGMGRAANELKSSFTLFDKTLLALEKGGTTLGTAGVDVLLPPASSQTSQDAIAEAKQIWQPYLTLITNLLNQEPGSQQFTDSLRQTVDYGRSNNLQLLALMNTVATDLERVASSKANTLRLIQTVGIMLALLNFMIIMFHSIRQLRNSDRDIEAARQETQEILETVNEGLFLLNNQGLIGNQYSAELEAIIGRRDIAGLTFEELLDGLVSDKDLETSQKFISLLFDPSKKEKLLGSLNPLSETEVFIDQGPSGYESKFLNFAFSRVMNNDKDIIHILVTVRDITKQVELARELEQAQKQGEQQFEMLSGLLQANGDLLPVYLKNSFRTLNQINNALREPAKSDHQLVQKADSIFKLMHKFKGESAALNLDQFVDYAHRFENEIHSIKTKLDLNGNDFLSLTIMLNQILSQLEAAQKLINKLGALTGQSANDPSSSQDTRRRDWSHFQNLASSVGERQNKSIVVEHSGLNDSPLSEELAQLLNDISIQLIRNAATHGIESADKRQKMSKPTTGKIDIRLVKDASGNFRYTFSDDGAGLDLNAILGSAIDKGLVSPEDAKKLSKKDIIALIFAPELSTKTEINQDAGRGVGMASIQDDIRRQGGKLGITSKSGQGCTFTICLPDNQSHIKIAA